MLAGSEVEGVVVTVGVDSAVVGSAVVGIAAMEAAFVSRERGGGLLLLVVLASAGECWISIFKGVE